jgi:hypothetical protein
MIVTNKCSLQENIYCSARINKITKVAPGDPDATHQHIFY